MNESPIMKIMDYVVPVSFYKALFNAASTLLKDVEVDDILEDIVPVDTMDQHLDEILGPKGNVFSPALSCLYFTECIGDICPCHLIDATVVVPQIKTYIKGGSYEK
jgi:hypothetical protein